MMLAEKGEARNKKQLNNLAQQLRRKIKALRDETINAIFSGRQPIQLKDLIYRVIRIRKQIENRPETINKKLKDLLSEPTI